LAITLSKGRLNALRDEITLAEKMNKEELEPLLAESLERYVGNYIPRMGNNWDIMLNEVYPIIQNWLPTIFFRNPRAFLKPRNKTYIVKQRNLKSGQMEDVQMDSTKSAKTQEQILNYNISEIKYKQEVRKCLLDALLFSHAVLWHGYKGEFGMTEEQSLYIKKDQVFVRRISPLDFIHDPSVTMNSLDEGKWVGRAIDIPLVDLLEDNTLDVDPKLIKGFLGYGNKVTGKQTPPKTSGQDKIRPSSIRTELLKYASKSFLNSPYARFVRVYEVFLRPTKKEKRAGSKGWILLLTEEQNKPLRKNDWKIKAEGYPSKLLQFNALNDSMYGIPDINTYKSIADQKNIITNLQIRNAQETTKTYIGVSTDGATKEEDIIKFQEGTNTIILFEGGNPRDKMFVAPASSGASQELYLIDQRIQRNLEDKSGITDLKRGFLQSGEESAASVKIRAAGGSARPAYRQDLMSDFLKDSLHYLNQLLKQFVPYKEAVRIMGSMDIVWSEKPNKQDLQADTDVEIDVISMLPENPDKELRDLQTLLMLMVEGMSNPVVANKIKQEGNTINLSPIIEQMMFRLKIRDPEIFRRIKPEESEGFVSVQQVRQARENVNAAIAGKPPPYPPQVNDDHRAKLEVYTSIVQLLKAMQQESEILMQLIQAHQILLQEIAEKQADPGRVMKLGKPTVSVPSFGE